MKSGYRRWLPVVVWVALIYTTIPFVRTLRELFIARWRGELIGFAVIAVVVAAAFGCGAVMVRRSRRFSASNALWLAAVAAVFVLWTLHLMDQPEEAVHFIEYGVLGVLLHRALRPTLSDATVFLTATILGTIVGTIDEIIQWIAPDRYWGFRDIVLNGGAVALVQLAIWRVVPPDRWPRSPRSLRRLFRLAAALVALLTACLANTPARVERWVPATGWLSHLRGGVDVMAEYGHLHVLDERTRFKSRLDRAQLAREDSTRADEVAAMLDASRGAYGEFLAAVSPTRDPFAYEARVHLFARDRNLQKGRQEAAGNPKRRGFMTEAWRENRIVEEVFAHTLAASSFAWGARRLDEVVSDHDTNAFFLSDVGYHLVTWGSERTIRWILLAVMAALLASDFALGRFTTPGAPPE